MVSGWPGVVRPTDYNSVMDVDAFLEAICDRPGDALPRLVLADFLDECGEPGAAEWLRADVRVAVLLPDHDPADLRALLTGEPPAGVPSLTAAKLAEALGDAGRHAARFFEAVGTALTVNYDALTRRGRLP
jgi:uncharacterized protein (TIGR02996 family)